MSEQPPEDRPMMHYALTLRHIIERAELLFPDREVVWREPDGSVARTNYRAVAERSRALGAALTGLGVGPGDRVATLGWNHANHLEAYFGVPNSGAVLHTINPRLHRDQLDYIMAKADDRVLLIDQSLLPLLD
ncbi:MAG: AMP-binding protein, partial [Actinomycetes bacterium]